MNSSRRTKMAYQAIKGLCGELVNLYNNKYHSLALYNRLVDTAPDSKVDTHVSKWREFLLTNAENLKKTETSEDFKFQYKTKIFINFNKILSTETSNTIINTIWEHLLTINAILDETSAGKELLNSFKAKKENEKKIQSKDNENFIGDAVKEIAQTMETSEMNTDDPMSTIMTLVSSPMFTSLVSNMKSKVENGDLDIASLMGTVTGMMTNLERGGPGPNIKAIEDSVPDDDVE